MLNHKTLPWLAALSGQITENKNKTKQNKMQPYDI